MYGIDYSLSTAPVSLSIESDAEERLLELGNKAALMLHQLKGPLSAAILYTEHLAEQAHLTAQQLKWIESLQICHANIEKQVLNLLLYIRGENAFQHSLSIEDWSAVLIKSISPYLEQYNAKCSINNHLGERNYLIDIHSLNDAIHNLILNSLQADAKCITLDLLPLKEKGLQLILEDNGRGMSDEIKLHASKPFFTTKEAGTGLGLFIVHSIIQAYKGSIRLESSLGKGCRITINLPG